MLQQTIIDKIIKITTENSGAPVLDVTVTPQAGKDGLFIRINTYNGLDNAKKAAKALLAGGMQHVNDDGIPEFTVSGAEGAKQQVILWSYDPSRPVFEKPTKKSDKD